MEVNFCAMECGFLLDFTVFKNLRSLSGESGPRADRLFNGMKHSSSARISSHCVDSESDIFTTEGGVIEEGVVVSSA